MENQERQPRGFAWKDTDDIVIKGALYNEINKTLRFFENAITVLNIIQQENIEKGIFKPFYDEDLVENKLRTDFFETQEKSPFVEVLKGKPRKNKTNETSN